MTTSRQGSTTRVTGTANLYREEGLELTALYTYYYLGMVPGEPGGDSTFYIMIYDNTVEIDYEISESVDINGPWDQLDEQFVVGVPFTPSEAAAVASGVFYGGVIRVGVKMSSPGSGTFSLKMLAK